MSKEKKLSKDELIKGLDLVGEYSKFDTKWKKQIRQLIEAQAEPSEAELEAFVERLVTKHWNPNWHDSRTIKGEVEWIMKFANELRRG